MIDINWAAAGVVITLLIALLSLAAWVGAISERVKRTEKDINKNSQEHQRIFDKLDVLRELIKNNH